MDDGWNNEFVDRLMRVACLAKPSDSNERGPFRICSTAEGTFFLERDGVVEFEQLVGFVISSRAWRDKLSRTYVEGELPLTIARSVGKDRTLVQQNASTFLGECERSCTSQTIYVPLDGIDMRLESLTVGNVELIGISDDVLNCLMQMIEAAVRATTNSDHEKSNLIARYRTRLDKEWKGGVCARYTAVSEPVRARERAEAETIRARGFIRYAAQQMYLPSHRISVGLFGEAPYTTRISFAFRGDGMNVNEQAARRLAPFEISAENVERLAPLGFFELSEMVQKETDSSASNFEQALILAAHWIGDAQCQMLIENKLLSLVTALEVLVTPKGRDPIRTSVAEAVAIIVGDTLEARRAIKAFVLEAYSCRSSVSHRGRGTITEGELTALTNLSCRFLIRLIGMRNEFQCREDLLRHMETERLAPSNSPAVNGYTST